MGGRLGGWRRRAAVVMAALFVVVAASCGSSGSDANPGTTVGTGPAGAAEPAAVPLPDDFPATVVLVLGEQFEGEQQVVAVDVATGARTVLADQATLRAGFSGADAQNAYVRSVSLTPDGSVVFSFGYDTWELHEVPIDGSAPARRLTELGAGFPYGLSPDGRWVPVVEEQLHLVAVDGSAPQAPAGVPLAYGPASLVWSPDGALLAGVPHFERSAPPPPLGYTVDPATGVLQEATEPLDAVGGPAGLRSGLPWYDDSGQLHVMGEGASLDGVGLVVLTSLGADTTHRWVIGTAAEYAGDVGRPAVEGDSRAWLVWWDATTATPVPHLLDLGVDLPDPALSSGWIAAAF